MNTRIIIAALLLTMAASLPASAQQLRRKLNATNAAQSLRAVKPTTAADTTATALRIKALNHRKMQLQAQLVTENKKRNQKQQGVAYETMENINERQDSLCLAIRSEIVSVVLEIEETKK